MCALFYVRRCQIPKQKVCKPLSRETRLSIKGLYEPTCECRVAVPWAGIFISLFLLADIKKCTFVVRLIANSRNSSFLLCL